MCDVRNNTTNFKPQINSILKRKRWRKPRGRRKKEERGGGGGGGGAETDPTINEM